MTLANAALTAVPILDQLTALLEAIVDWVQANAWIAAVLGILGAGILVMILASHGLRRAGWIIVGAILTVGAVKFGQALADWIGR